MSANGKGDSAQAKYLEAQRQLVELEQIVPKEIPPQAGYPHGVLAEASLVGQIVNRKDTSSLSQLRHIGVVNIEIDWEQPRLPIVGIDDVWLDAQGREGFQDGTSEEDITGIVVRIVLHLPFSRLELIKRMTK